MAEQGEEDVSNEYRLVRCNGCHEEFPAISQEDHKEFCKVIFELISTNAPLEVVQEYLEQPIGHLQLDFQDHDIHSDDEGAFEEICCEICLYYFPRIGMKEHKALCQHQKELNEVQNEVKEVLVKNPVPQNDEEKPKLESNPREKNMDEIDKHINQLPKVKDVLVKNPVPQNDEGKPKLEPNPREKNMDEIDKHINQLPKELNISFDEKTEITSSGSDENQTFKLPQNPLLGYVDQTENEDLENISDDEDSETLEEFWKRAQNFIKSKQQYRVNA